MGTRARWPCIGGVGGGEGVEAEVGFAGAATADGGAGVGLGEVGNGDLVAAVDGREIVAGMLRG